MLREQRNDCARQASACETEIAARDRVGNVPPKFLFETRKSDAGNSFAEYFSKPAGTIAFVAKIVQSATVFTKAGEAR
ncbi:MAG: hypothetical protein WBE69_03525 [Candidatus Binataceae bacterium]|jgi:hypothetical protein